MLDANILIAAFVRPRGSYALLEAARAGRLKLVLCPYVVKEAWRMISRAFRGRAEGFERLLEETEMAPDADPAEIARNAGLVSDPADIPVALAALAAGVEYLVTSDRRFRDDLCWIMGPDAPLKVVTPTELLRRLNTQTPMSIADLQVTALPTGKHVLDVEACRSTAGAPLPWTLLVARGRQPGRTLLVTAGVHGDEYEGMAAIREVFGTLNPAEMAGTFVGLPVVNVPAYHAVTREGGDGLNMARVFPGDPAGSDTQRLAHALATSLMPQADLYCDLHSAGLHYEILPFAGYCLRDDAMGQIQREAAWAFGLEIVWAGPYLPGRSLSAAYERDLPAIYTEMPGGGRCHAQDVARDVEGLRRLMRYLGILAPALVPEAPLLFVEDRAPEAAHLQIHHVAEADGFFRPAVRLGQDARAGAPFGEIVDDAGRSRQQLRCDTTGRVIFLRATPRVTSGTTCGTILGTPE